MANFIKPKMVRILNSLSVDMVHIKKGNFMMELIDGDEKKGTSIVYDMSTVATNSNNERVIVNTGDMKEVTIDNDFELGRYPITIAEYLHFAYEEKKEQIEFIEAMKEKDKVDENAPIVDISWFDAKKYCTWLSNKTGKKYRLPREIEWEYACRAGTTTKWSFGDNEEELEEYAWYDKNPQVQYPARGRELYPVGKKKPNLWGLYDMHGGVLEWCEDDYSDNDKLDNGVISMFPKVCRGGSSIQDSRSTYSSTRDRESATLHRKNLGFRILKEREQNIDNSENVEKKSHLDTFNPNWFQVESKVVEEFKNWKDSTQAQEWLKVMNYQIEEIENINVVIPKRIYKHDIQIEINFKDKNSRIVNLQLKTISNKQGFIQVDNGMLKKYAELWDIPSNVYTLLKYFTGEIEPRNDNTRNKTKMYLDELSKEEQEIVVDFFNEHKALIVNDILVGRDKVSPDWILIMLRTNDNHSKWILVSMEKSLNHFSKGDVAITSRGSLKIGNITMQSKGGNNSSLIAHRLQFKVNLAEIIDI